MFLLTIIFLLYNFYNIIIIIIIFPIISDDIRGLHSNLQELADANSRPMSWAMTDKCPAASTKLLDDQASLLYEAKSTYSAEWRLL